MPPEIYNFHLEIYNLHFGIYNFFYIEFMKATLYYVSFIIRIGGVLLGLTPGNHGFHIHEYGDLGDHCTAAGGHFNPNGVGCQNPLNDINMPNF